VRQKENDEQTHRGKSQECSLKRGKKNGKERGAGGETRAGQSWTKGRRDHVSIGGTSTVERRRRWES